MDDNYRSPIPEPFRWRNWAANPEGITGDELLEFMHLADYACFNDYEAKLLSERCGRSIGQLAREVKALVVTRGAAGSLIHAQGRIFEIPCAMAEQVVDPTGCGDAYRAGLLYGLSNGFDWPTTGRLASLMGALKIAQRGGQNHYFERGQIDERYRQAFGSALF